MNKLKQLRNDKGITQEKLGKLMGVSKRTIISWEKSERLKLRTDKAQQLADFFNVSVAYLLGDTPNRKTYDDETIYDEYADLGLILAYSETRNNEEDEKLQFKQFVQYIKSNHLLLTDTEIKSFYNLLISIDLNNSNSFKGLILKKVLHNKEFVQYKEQFLKDYSILHDEQYEKTEDEIMLDVYLKELKIDIGIQGILNILKPIADENHKKLSSD